MENYPEKTVVLDTPQDKMLFIETIMKLLKNNQVMLMFEEGSVTGHGPVNFTKGSIRTKLELLMFFHG
ncbi:MAG TPA: hypothetical protein DIC25_08230 [Weissella cibaria]|nr:hypothetical protein [Weissella cibaria]